MCPVGIADRVNLGLIPSSESGWHVACRALKPREGGVLHVHGNVTSFTGSYIANADANDDKTNWIKPNNNTTLDSNSGERTNHLSQVTNISVTDFHDKVVIEKTVDSVKSSSVIESDQESGNGLDFIESAHTYSGAGINMICNPHNNSEQGHGNVAEGVCKDNLDKDKKNFQIGSRDSSITEDLGSSLWKCDPHQWKRTEWVQWAQNTAWKIRDILIDLHGEEWRCHVLHIEHVKSYAAHIDHMVVDIECRPLKKIQHTS